MTEQGLSERAGLEICIANILKPAFLSILPYSNKKSVKTYVNITWQTGEKNMAPLLLIQQTGKCDNVLANQFTILIVNFRIKNLRPFLSQEAAYNQASSHGFPTLLTLWHVQSQ